MRRTASGVIRELESRIARLEGRTANATKRIRERFDIKPRALDIDLQSDLEMVAETYNLVAVCTEINGMFDHSLSKELKVAGDRLYADFPTSEEAEKFRKPLSVEGVILSETKGETHHHSNNFSYGVFHTQYGGQPHGVWVGLVPKKYTRPMHQERLITAGFSNDNPKVESEVKKIVGEFAFVLVDRINRLRK